MDADVAKQFIDAIRETGFYPSDSLVAAESLVTGPPVDDLSLAEKLQSLGVLTSYQYRKIRSGRVGEVLFGPYLILDKIGEGGMGKVYRAFQHRVGRIVALKVVRQQLASNKVVLRRYKREAEAVAALNHPNIVSLFDADEIHGRYYLAMEYVDGIDLSRLVKEFGNPPQTGLTHYQEACEYIRQAALGLQHAHDKGMVHRDIKPSNLLVYGERALPGTSGKAIVKILDMGLVRSMIEIDELSRTDLTRDGTVVGTPDYMAPEQAKNSSTVDHRADIYALGCTLYYLLKGQPPFPEGSPIDKLLRHQLDPPPSLKQSRPDLPPGLIGLIEKLLKKKPGERYQSSTEVAQALGPYTVDGASLITTPVEMVEPVVPARPAAPHEPFSFTDDPNAVVANTATPPPAANTTPPPTSPPTGSSPQPAGVRLRVLKPVSPATPKSPVAVPKPATAVAVPRADAAPSSESLPGASTGRTTRAEASSPTTRRKVRKAPPPRKSSSRGWLLPVILGAGFLFLLVVAVAIVANRRDHTAPSVKDDSGSDPGKSSAGPNTPTAPPLAPLRTLLPDRANCILVVHPQPYWKRGAYDALPNDLSGNHLKGLQTRARFDARLFERAIITCSDTSHHWLAIGEGNFVTPTWLQGLDTMKGAKVEKTSNDQKMYTFSPWGLGPRFAAPLGTQAYVIGGDRNTVGSLVARVADKKPAVGQDEELLRALVPAESTQPPIATFAANSKWALPDGTDLGKVGIHKIVGTVRLDGDYFFWDVTITGKDRARLKDFVSENIATGLPRRFPGFTFFAEQIATAEPSFQENGSMVDMHISGRIPWKKFHEQFARMLPVVPNDSKSSP